MEFNDYEKYKEDSRPHNMVHLASVMRQWGGGGLYMHF